MDRAYDTNLLLEKLDYLDTRVTKVEHVLSTDAKDTKTDTTQDQDEVKAIKTRLCVLETTLRDTDNSKTDKKIEELQHKVSNIQKQLDEDNMRCTECKYVVKT